jgi:hypothetical protein
MPFPVQNLTVQNLEDSGALQELAAVFSTREDALYLLANIPGLNTGRLPEFNATNASNYWRQVTERLGQGIVENGLEALMAAAAREFPGNGKFRPYARRGELPPPPGSISKPSRALVIEIHADELDEQVLALWTMAKRLAEERGGEAKLDIITKGSTRLHVSLEHVTEEDAEAIARVLQRSLPASAKANVYREPHTFRDYLMDPLFAEGPDGQRFELDHVRASTRVGEVAQGVVSQYEDAFWPTDKAGRHASPTVDVRNPDGDVRRLQSDQTLHDAGVRPRDTLSVFPERRAGSVNPLLRAESLTIVRNQIVDFARTHPGFEVEANSVDIPTEYLFRFQAPGFEPGTPLRLIDRHEVLLVMPPEFPVKAPQAYWQHELFHPNVDAATGLVCLGVLAESYRPGIHFGTLCQMLVDMASFRNYEIDEGYNEDAARWAASDEGQQAIRAIGGRSREEMLGLREQPARRINVRKVGP